jgi:hypothetical protein
MRSSNVNVPLADIYKRPNSAVLFICCKYANTLVPAATSYADACPKSTVPAAIVVAPVVIHFG